MNDEEDVDGGTLGDYSEIAAAVLGVQLARQEQIVKEIEIFAQTPWRYEDGKNIVVYSMVELAYSFPKRVYDFVEPIRFLSKNSRTVPAVTLARSLVEAVAMGSFYIKCMEKCISEANFEAFEKKFLRFYLGSKIADCGYKPIHVNDALRDLERRDLDYLSYLVQKYPKQFKILGDDPVNAFRENASILNTYDKLSEISHPNGLGTQYFYPAIDAPDNKKIVNHYNFLTNMAIWQAHHLTKLLPLVKCWPENMSKIFPENEKFSIEIEG